MTLVEKHFWIKPWAYYDGPPGVLSVNALVAQVQDERGGAVEESKHAHTHEELGRRRVVALQEGGVDLSAVTQGYLERRSLQPNGNKEQRICRSVRLPLVWQVMRKKRLTCINLLSEEGKKRKYNRIKRLKRNRSSEIRSH